MSPHAEKAWQTAPVRASQASLASRQRAVADLLRSRVTTLVQSAKSIWEAGLVPVRGGFYVQEKLRVIRKDAVEGKRAKLRVELADGVFGSAGNVELT